MSQDGTDSDTNGTVSRALVAIPAVPVRAPIRVRPLSAFLVQLAVQEAPRAPLSLRTLEAARLYAAASGTARRS